MKTIAAFVLTVVLAVMLIGAVAAQTQGDPTTGPDTGIDVGDGEQTTENGSRSPPDLNYSEERNQSWYERIRGDDNRSRFTELPISSEETNDSIPPGAADFNHRITTYTMAGDVTPQEGAEQGLHDIEANNIHVIAQFYADDPTIDSSDEGFVNNVRSFVGDTLGVSTDREGDIQDAYDLSYCGSYMHRSGWENAHCFGVPEEELAGFLNDSRVRAVLHRDADWKMYPEIQQQLEGGSERLVVETYPDSETSGNELDERHDVNFTVEHGAPDTYTTNNVSSYDTARSIAGDENVSWVGWLRPAGGTLDDSREHVGAVDMNGRVGSGGDGVTGDGVWIGVLDSGIHADPLHQHFDHPEVSVEFSADWVDWGMPPEDEDGHGTHVAGTITGNSTNNGDILTGVAPHSNIVVARGLNANAQWAFVAGRIMPYSRFQRMQSDAPETMAAISNSWGVDDTSRATPLSRYDKIARSADKWAVRHQDTLIVVSNGNSCHADPSVSGDAIGCAVHVATPALGKNVLSVGATNKDGEVSQLNDLNPPEDVVDLNNGRVKPEVLAPGVNVEAPIPPPQVNNAPSHGEKSGTSMAAPHVSGVVALLKEEYPGLTANELRSLLIATTSPVDNPNGYLEGYGEVNAHDAMYRNNYESRQFKYGSSIQDGGRHIRKFTVSEDAERIDASLTWMDPNKVAGGTDGFIFNRLDVKLDGPDSWHSDLDPKNVKKLTVRDPEPGEWRLIVTGPNVGPAFKPFEKLRNDEHTQSYDGFLRVVEHESRVEVVVETANMTNPVRADHLDDNDVRVGRGDQVDVDVKAVGVGSVVSDVEVEIDTGSATDISFCDGSSTTSFSAGDLSRSQEANRSVCLEAHHSASIGDRDVEVRIDSTNGADSSASTNVVEIPVFVTENTPPAQVQNVRSPSHTVGEWTSNTTFRFRWDRGTDLVGSTTGGSGIDGYYHDLTMIGPTAVNRSGYTVETPSELYPQYVDDADSTSVEITLEPDRMCFDPQTENLDCSFTSGGTNWDGSHWFYIKAQDRSKNIGPRASLGPFKVDQTPPEPFELKLGNTTDGRVEVFSKGSPFFYDVDSTSVEVLWERPDDFSGIRNYSYEAVEGQQGATLGSGSFTHSDVYIGPGHSVDSALRISGLQPGENHIGITARDMAGNTRTAIVDICVEGDSCTTPAQAEQARRDIRRGLQAEEAGLTDPERIIDGDFDQRLRDEFRCPGTYLCGDQRPGWYGLVDGEHVLINIEDPDGEVVGRYYAEISDGEATNVQRVTDPGEVDQSVNVYMDIGTVRTVMAADNKIDALGSAYEAGRIRLQGVGIMNSVKYGVFNAGAAIHDTVPGL